MQNIYFIYKASSGVNCGSHFAVSCNRCANGRQSQRQAKHWCKGECTWDPYSNIIGGCIKKFGKLYTSIPVRRLFSFDIKSILNLENTFLPICILDNL